MTGAQHDPLREQFNAEPLLLTPPPGQLGFVTARARRRRVARLSAVLASSVLSLAAVFAGGALVTSRLLSDRDRHPVTGQPTETPTAEPEPSATLPGVVAPTEPPRVRPDKDTQVLDLTWISTESGWALGRIGGCTQGPSCPPPTGPQVYSVLHTADGARSWDKLATLPGKSCCDFAIRFANKTTGYLILDGRLLVSMDAGRTWTPAGLDQRALAVEAGRDSVTVLTNDSADGLCGACQVWVASLAGTDWHSTLTLPGRIGELRRSGDLVVAAALVNPAGGADNRAADLHISRDGGEHWGTPQDPCVVAKEADELSAYALGFEVAGSVVVTTCDAFTASGTPFEREFVLRSSDGAKNFAPRQDSSRCGVTVVLVADADTFACTGSGVLVSRDAGATWGSSLSQHGTDEYACGFQNGRVGRCFLGSVVWTTRDAGRTWSNRDVSAS